VSFLRLGVKCAVIDSDGRILLSKRADLGVWNLPGGRLDPGERFDQAAAREVLEETGVQVEITHPVGLYYWQGWSRINMLFAARPVGGQLLPKTDETTANHYFAPEELPSIWGPEYIGHVLSPTRPLPQIVALSRAELLSLRAQLRWRWLKNWLRGRREPRFPRFTVRAVAVIYTDDYQRILTLPQARTRTFPRITSDGQIAPWQQLAATVRRFCSIGGLHWVGLWQEVETDTIELIFAAAIPETQLTQGAEWSAALNAPLTGYDAEYVRRIVGDYATKPVWTSVAESLTTIIPG